MSTPLVVAILFLLALGATLLACHFAVKAMQKGFAARQSRMADDPGLPWDR